MKLEFVFFADAAAITTDGLFSVVGGGFEVIQSSEFPATKSAMVLIARVAFSRRECGKPYTMRGEIFSPSHQIVPPTLELSFIPPSHPRKPESGNGMTICLNYQGLQFDTPGDYTFQLSIGDRVIGTAPLEVVKITS